MLRVSSHAIERYQERIANVSDDEARANQIQFNTITALIHRGII